MSTKRQSPSPIAEPLVQPVIAVEPVSLDLKAAAAFLGATLRQIRTLCYGRELVPIRLGKKQVLLVSELRQFIQRQRQAP